MPPNEMSVPKDLSWLWMLDTEIAEAPPVALTLTEAPSPETVPDTTCVSNPWVLRTLPLFNVLWNMVSPTPMLIESTSGALIPLTDREETAPVAEIDRDAPLPPMLPPK